MAGLQQMLCEGMLSVGGKECCKPICLERSALSLTPRHSLIRVTAAHYFTRLQRYVTPQSNPTCASLRVSHF